MSIKELPEIERPREKMILYGSSALSEAELLAVLIRTGYKDITAIELSNKIMMNGMKFLATCTPDELLSMKGVGSVKACQIVAAIELGKRIATKGKIDEIEITSPQDIASLFMEKMRYYQKEYFQVVMIDTKGKVIHIENTSIGDLNSALVHPREVFSKAVKKSAASIILVHNHPSGCPEPSNEDINITKRLMDAGEILGIKVLDHIIIGDGNFVSLKSKNLM